MSTTDQCFISTETISGWRAVVMENDLLRLVILPDKGADIYTFIHKPSGVDFLFKAPWQLQPPGALPREGSGDLEFLWNYEGCWQELFPSANDPCTYRGRAIPFHGEVATLAWEDQIIVNDPDELAVRFSVRCRQTPFRLERFMRLRRGEPDLILEETVTNESDSAAHFVWGHHCVVGPPFLEAGCRFETPARTIVTIPEMYEPTARLQPGQREPWPVARLRNGGTVDLRDVPGPEAQSHDDIYLTDLTAGWVAVTNPRLDLTFTLRWDPVVFHWIITWQPYGGAEAMPLAGAYALGIEPWISRLNLEQAVAAGEAIELPGGKSFNTTLRALVEHGGRRFESKDGG
jgi:hypothetical protein